jgi:uncharacterized protein YodC (DUF2158 family)
MAQGSGFAVGSIVKLKSGGPEMTVQAVMNLTKGTYLRCQWFAGKKLESGDFPPDSLEVVPPQPKAP